MTRFARAKGSKSSNERVPEEATPWNQMKQQMLEKSKYIVENKNRQDFINQRTANYKAFIEEKELEESKKSQWAQFPTDIVQKAPEHLKNKTKKPHFLVDDVSELSDNDESFVALKAKVDEVLKKSENSKISYDNDSDAPPEEESSKVQIEAPSPKVKKVKKKKLSIASYAPPEEESSKVQIEAPPTKVKKVKKKKLSIAININTSSNETDNVEVKTISKKRKKENNNEAGETKKSKISGNIESISNKTKGNKKGKNPKGKIEPKKIVKENLTEQDIKKLEKKKQRRIKQIEKKKLVKAELKKKKEEEEQRKLVDGETVTANSVEENLENGNKQKFIPQNQNYENRGKFEKSNTFNNRAEQKPPKPRDKKEHNRKKPQLPNKMFINGKEVEIDYVDGFPVKKEDAERLKKLRKEMISKGLPRSEINIALKLERRRAEKAFTREKKKVCFNCRKSGHNLSECPDLEKGQFAQAGTGICFKCGSTEHTHFECKVVRTQDFKYAQCFICNEQGHIARQCPDNNRGLYPKGGSCKVCGDVTHLKRDCPKYQAQQQQLQSSFNAESIGDKPDELDDTNNSSNFRVADKRPNKVIKF